MTPNHIEIPNHIENEAISPLTLADPAGPGELPPEHLGAWLDRLVDGEIAEPQRRALLSRLERAPDGWRHCALAFLEAQAWREALEQQAMAVGSASEGPNAESKTAAAISRLSLVPNPSSVSAPESATRSRRLAWSFGPMRAIVAAAASFVIAFGLGLLVHRLWLSPGSVSGPARSLAGKGIDPASRAAAAGPTAAVAPKGTQWGSVEFAVADPSGAPQQVRLPAVDGPDPAEFLREQPPVIPDEIVQALRRHGHHVQTHRRYMPVPLDDGRSAVFPIDQVEVRFRGGNGYQ
jgi:hypothetical protein